MSDLSRLNPTPHAITVYASQPLSPGVTQHSLPSGAAPYLGRTSTGWIAPACLAHSLDDLVGAGEDRGRELDAEFPGGFLVNYQLDRDRLLGHGLARFGTFQHLIHVGGEHRIHFRPLDAVACEAAGLHHLAELADCRELVFEREPAEVALKVR